MKKILLICAAIIANFGLQAQGCLKGHVIDAKTEEPLPFVKIMVFKDGKQLYERETDFDGLFIIKAPNLDSCDIIIRFVGYLPYKRTGIRVYQTGFTMIEAALMPITTKLETVTIEDSRYGHEGDTLLQEYKIVDKDIKRLLDRVIDGRKHTYDYEAETSSLPKGTTCDLYLFLTPAIDTSRDSVSGIYNYFYMCYLYDTTLPYPLKGNAPLFSFDSMTTCVQVETTYKQQSFVKAEGYVEYRGRYFFLHMPVNETDGYFRKTVQTKIFRHVYLPPWARQDPPTWLYTKQQGHWYRWMELPNGF